MLKDKTAIVGIGETEFSKSIDSTELNLACKAIKNALDDAGISPDQVDALGSFTYEETPEFEIARNLGFGDRSWRYAAIINDKNIEHLFIEPNLGAKPKRSIIRAEEQQEEKKEDETEDKKESYDDVKASVEKSQDCLVEEEPKEEPEKVVKKNPLNSRWWADAVGRCVTDGTFGGGGAAAGGAGAGGAAP